MKTIFAFGVALLAVNCASAQIFGPQGVNGSVLRHRAERNDGGRSDGGERGRGDFGRGDWNRGDVHRGHDFGRGHSIYVDRHFHGGYFGGGIYRGSYFPRYTYFPGYSYYPSYGYYSGYGYGYPYYDYGYYGTPTAATNGLLLGALAGGIIGNNSGSLHHSAWRGSAWGAGIGWLLGSFVDANRRAAGYQQAPVITAPVATAPSAPAQTQPQQVTIINNYYSSSTPMSSVNGMFGR